MDGDNNGTHVWTERDIRALGEMYVAVEADRRLSQAKSVRCLRNHRVMTFVMGVLTVFVGSHGLSQFATSTNWLEFLSGVLSILLAIVATVQSNFPQKTESLEWQERVHGLNTVLSAIEDMRLANHSRMEASFLNMRQELVEHINDLNKATALHNDVKLRDACAEVRAEKASENFVLYGSAKSVRGSKFGFIDSSVRKKPYADLVRQPVPMMPGVSRLCTVVEDRTSGSSAQSSTSDGYA